LKRDESSGERTDLTKLNDLHNKFRQLKFDESIALNSGSFKHSK